MFVHLYMLNVPHLQNVLLLSLVFAAIGAIVFSVGVGDCSQTFWD